MNWKIFGIVVGLVAIGSISSARVQSSEVSESVSEPIELAETMEIARQINNPIDFQKLPPQIDRKLFFGNPEISGAQLSPDGKFLAFRKPLNGVINVWLKGIDEPFTAARPITEDKTRPILGYFWSQDSKYILYVQDKEGNENFHIYAVSPTAKPAPGKLVPPARDLTPYENVLARIIAVPDNTPETIIVGLNDRDPRYHDVYRLNLRSGERELVFKNEQNAASWLTDLEGNLQLATINLPGGGTEIRRIEGDKLVPVYSCKFGETCNPIRFHPDGDRVYMETNRGDRVDLTRLVLFNPRTGKIEIVDSDPKQKVDFGRGIFSKATKELIATVFVGDRQRIYPQNRQFARDLAFLNKTLPKGELGFYSMTKDGRLMLVSLSSDIEPGSTYLFDRKTQKLTKLYSLLPELDRQDLAPMRSISYTARDGLEIPAYLTLPKGIPARNLPLVVFPHGGPWGRDVWGYRPLVQFLANRGYAVFQPNFRGSTGYGKAFLNAGNKQWGTGAMQHDITDGVKYLIKRGTVDPNRVAIFGISYGGYATLAGLAFTPDLYTAGVSYVGPSNLITLFTSIPPYWETYKALFKLRVGDIDTSEGKKLLRQQSPLFSAKRIKAPLMVIQGANDPRVKKAESEQIVVALRDLNRNVEYLLAPNEGHGFRNENNRLAVAAAMERFLFPYLGGRYQKSISPEVKERLEVLTVDINDVSVSNTQAENNTRKRGR